MIAACRCRIKLPVAPASTINRSGYANARTPIISSLNVCSSFPSHVFIYGRMHAMPGRVYPGMSLKSGIVVRRRTGRRGAAGPDAEEEHGAISPVWVSSDRPGCSITLRPRLIPLVCAIYIELIPRFEPVQHPTSRLRAWQDTIPRDESRDAERRAGRFLSDMSGTRRIDARYAPRPAH